MLSLWRASLPVALLVAVAALLVPPDAQGQDKKNDVTFSTADGVTLSGTFYSAAKPRKDGAVVMLLHNFTPKGGGSSEDGWPTLAKSLQAAGFHVLSFDFRGYGDSKEVSKDAFWKHKHNLAGIKNANPAKQDRIDHSKFNASYYRYLINDIAAAKAYLDRANDRKEVNSSNLLIIGAGQGATLGAAWLANESYRKRDKRPKDELFGQIKLADEPEAYDVAGCIWLTISPTVEGQQVGGLLRGTWLPAAAKTNKVPMLFYYGENDKNGSSYAKDTVKALKGASKVTSVASGGTSLAGSKLLDKKVIGGIPALLENLIDERPGRAHEQVDKKVADSTYYYVVPPSKIPLRQPNKKAGEDVPPVDLSVLKWPGN